MGRTFDRAVSTPSMDAVIANNIALNGGMEVSQENGTTLTTVVSGTPKYSVDQFVATFVSTGVLKFQQVAPPGTPAFGAGFQNCLQLTATTAFGALAAGEYGALYQPIEGYRWAKLGFGNATNPQYVTIGFWVYATIAGTMTVSLRNSGVNRAYLSNVTITAAQTWEYKTVTILADTSGTWSATTGIGAYLSFCFGSGSTFQGTNGAWQAANVFATSATTNFFVSLNNVVAITGVCVWPGTDAPTAARSPLAKRSFDEELTLCMRHWEKSYGYTVAIATASERLGARFGVGVGTSQIISVQFAVPKRATPTIALYSYNGTSGVWTAAATDADTAAATAADIGLTGWYRTSTSGLTTGSTYYGHFTASARL